MKLLRFLRVLALALCGFFAVVSCDWIFGDPDDPWTPDVPPEVKYTISVKPGGPVDFPGAGGSVEFSVTTNAKHTGCSYPKYDWLSMSYNKDGGVYVATVAPNETGDERSFELTFYAYNSDSDDKEATKVVKCFQVAAESGKVSVTAAPSSVEFPAEGGSKDVVVSWSEGVNNLSYSRSDAVSGWVKCEWKNSGGKKLLVLNADANESGEARSGEVYVYAGLTADDISDAKAGKMNPARAAVTKITVSQPAAQATSVKINASPKTLEFSPAGETLKTDVTWSSGVKKVYSLREDSIKSWIHTEWKDNVTNGSSLYVTADANASGSERSGIIKVFAALSQEDLDAALAGNMNTTRVAVVQITVKQPAAGQDDASGAFTADKNGHKVVFAKGNLQYQANTGKWRFASNQWDYIGSDNSKISSSYSGWIDLFGWGTSGYNCGNLYYRPYDCSVEGTPYGMSSGVVYGPKGETTLTGTNANSDWGVYNAISNGGNQKGLWRTLTYDEWHYLISGRTTSSGIRYAKAKVNSKNGLILFPDNWNKSTYTINKTNDSDASYSSNSISSSDWSKLENAGCVFLPAAGQRIDSEDGYVRKIDAVGTTGAYWSSTGTATSSDANFLIFAADVVSASYAWPRCEGRSVRLVQNR